MTFDSIIAQAGSDIIDHAGVSAIFVSLTGPPPVSCAAYLDTEEDLQPVGFESTGAAQVTTIRYLLSTVGKVAARGEYFIINETRYIVESIEENGDKDGVVKVIVK